LDPALFGLTHQTFCFPLCRQPSIGRELVHRFGQRPAQPGEQLFTRDSRLSGEPINLLIAQCLFKQFRQNGQGDKALSWIARGPNKSISPSELEQALGDEKIDWLTRETGISREELLSGLSRALPETVDKLTPDGRLPTEREAERLVC